MPLSKEERQEEGRVATTCMVLILEALAAHPTNNPWAEILALSNLTLQAFVWLRLCALTPDADAAVPRAMRDLAHKLTMLADAADGKAMQVLANDIADTQVKM